ncbi:uncharacterized protein LOC143916318 [Arctopsyche grandis]|uniref:uncharacterized protein LOC143916318 n=1 Tax=Arctopsyche grandis TaxID=121162 RepID=UPI00406D9B70
MKCSCIILLLATLTATNADTSKWLDFRVKYSPVSTGVDFSAFWKIHKTLSEALANGWIRVAIDDNELGAITVCRSGFDLRVCPLYDGNGFIAGMQLAIPPSDVEGHGVPYDFNRFPVFQKKFIQGVLFWTSTYYLVDPAVIAAGGRTSAPTIGEGLWLKNGTSYTEVPTDEASIKSKTTYTWQNCIPNMGIHYYNNMTPDLNCEDFQPFFLLVKEKNLIGVGWQFSGKTKYVDYNWYDIVTSQGVKATAPLGPKCLAEDADTYGVISIHMYFTEKPWAIPCDQSTESVVPLS